MKILITSGATIEQIDGVRHITNFSTGKTGADIADYLIKKNCRVCYLHGVSAAMPGRKCRTVKFTGFADLNGKVKAILAKENFDKIVHLAAVGDYSVSRISIGGKKFAPDAKIKLPSGRAMTVFLKPNFKIIDNLPLYARNNAVIIGFKLTRAKSAGEISKAVKKVDARFVVHNDMKDIEAGKRIFRIYKDGKFYKKCVRRAELAGEILKLC